MCYKLGMLISRSMPDITNGDYRINCENKSWKVKVRSDYSLDCYLGKYTENRLQRQHMTPVQEKELCMVKGMKSRSTFSGSGEVTARV